MTNDDHRPLVLAAIVNYNGASMTVAALETLLQQGAGDRVSAVVIDNGSAAADLAAVEAGTGDQAEILSVPTNRGYAAACNAASQLAADRGIPNVLWLNNDLALEPGTLNTLLQALEASPRAAAVVAVSVDAESGRRVLGAGMDFTLWRSSVRHRLTGADVRDLPAAAYPVEVIAGTCMLVRVSVLRVIGGMDEGYFMYGEDVDWSLRARAAGFELLVAPAARARHGGARSSLADDRLRFLMRNRIRLIRARAGPATQVVFMAYFVLGWLPAYTVVRLIPRFGLVTGLRLAVYPLRWNIDDALNRRRWRLRPEDQVIPRP